MIAFDAPSREFCVSLRIQTNTPLQALVTLNDPVYVEAAQALARRMAGHGEGLEEEIRYGYRLALLTEPDAPTMARLSDLYGSVKASYAEDPALLEAAVEPYRPYDAPAEEADGYTASVTSAPLDEHPIFAEAPDDPAHVAALTTVATVIMNLDGFLTKD